MHGFTVDELINQDIGVYAPPGTRKPLTRDQLSELKSRNRETTNVRRDGSVFPVHLRSDAVENASGEVLGVVTTCEDITERKGSLEQLRAAQLQVIQAEKLESIGRMAAGVAHEVKNPLMTILTGVPVEAPADTDEPIRVLLGDMTEAVGRADAIIGGLLNFSRSRELDTHPADERDHPARPVAREASARRRWRIRPSTSSKSSRSTCTNAIHDRFTVRRRRQRWAMATARAAERSRSLASGWSWSRSTTRTGDTRTACGQGLRPVFHDEADRRWHRARAVGLPADCRHARRFHRDRQPQGRWRARLDYV